MAVLAERLSNCGSVPFYGCAKCRWSRSGCIWWKCNPEKFRKHFAQFPEKYVGNVLKSSYEKKMAIGELLGYHPEAEPEELASEMAPVTDADPPSEKIPAETTESAETVSATPKIAPDAEKLGLGATAEEPASSST